jgi:Sulfotransferase family
MSASTDGSAVKVLFIAGTGRSGTTILNSILGQVPGFFSAGEVRYVWERGILEDHRCGCGEPFSRCPVWTAVTHKACNGRAVDVAGTASRLQRRLRVRRVPLMIWRRNRRRPAIEPHADDLNILRIYRALAELPGVEVIVDSSKLPPYGLLLSSLVDIELFVVHLVRDPRATAFSWRRTKTTHDTSTAATMPKLETWRSAVLWLMWNSLTAAWWPRSSKHNILVRYEDLVRDPAVTVGRILQVVGSGLPANLISGHSVTLSPTHSVAGNPNRHDSGVVQLRSDDEWRLAMRRRERLFVTALTAPGLRRFGYEMSTGLRKP